MYINRPYIYDNWESQWMPTGALTSSVRLLYNETKDFNLCHVSVSTCNVQQSSCGYEFHPALW